jgi:hypothetical protein
MFEKKPSLGIKGRLYGELQEIHIFTQPLEPIKNFQAMTFAVFATFSDGIDTQQEAKFIQRVVVDAVRFRQIADARKNRVNWRPFAHGFL